ncbi:hypothetical protein [Rhodococcus kronopolitis]|uniref:Peptidase MA superfamily protein n=1 Tax=Rhodococcus kronopolitis TaxID=1460226 RepID=A0ABV9FJK4_9NOCA
MTSEHVTPEPGVEAVARPGRRRIRPWEALALAGLLCALGAAGGVALHAGSAVAPDAGTTASAPVNPFEQARRAGVQVLLDRWAAAVRNGDGAALAALFDEHAVPGFLDAEVRRANNLSGVPLADWGYEIGHDPEVPVPTDLAEQLAATDVWAPPVYLRYAVAGADAAPTRKPVSLVVARRGDEWKLVTDRDLPGARSTWRGPWDFGPLVAREVTTGSNTSVVLGHPDQQAWVDAVADEMQTAVPAVAELWGADWARRAVVFVASGQEEFAAQAGPEHSGADIAAVAVSDAVVPGSPVTGQRIVFSPAAANRLTAVGLRSVLRHELAHVAARSGTRDGSPLWALEGFADYAGHRGSGVTVAGAAPTVAAAVAAHGPPARLPSDADFAAGGERAVVAYELAWSVNAFVADEFGESALRELYRALAAGPVDAAALDGRLRATLGLTTAELVSRWGTWVTAHVA